MRDKMVLIKKCPFCGHKAQLISACKPRFIYCENCFAQGPHAENEKDAAALWNNRK